MIRKHLTRPEFILKFLRFGVLFMIAFVFENCTTKSSMERANMTTLEMLSNPSYLAISYGGYRNTTRDIQPSVQDIKEDMKLLAAMGIKFVRTYNVKLLHASTVLKAIHELKLDDPNFEMYVMLGVWIDCKNAWTDLAPDHEVESPENQYEIERAIQLANQYPDIVKIIAVGNEAMVKWAEAYYVPSSVILKWVKHLQSLKSNGKLPSDILITSSDNFASWGGGTSDYHNRDLEELIQSVDYISMHTYPMHDTHYNPDFWGILPEENNLSKEQKINAAMHRATEYAKMQFKAVKKYADNIKKDIPIHIGETGWASASDGFYGSEGSYACDEYKQSLYYQNILDWTKKEGIACFFFEAFDEVWKDAGNPNGSENHFGLFTVDGKAKYVLWNLVDESIFQNLGRDGKLVEKTYDGNFDKLMNSVQVPKSIIQEKVPVE
ncbi:MAG TPA: glycosyl hydrolase family 17 protein [Saprospiraceae bacterium]|nr:glycosyl hydrolase family 17 protein [Saprospiraceae bacterium]